MTTYPEITDEHFKAETDRRDIERNSRWLGFVRGEFPEPFGSHDLRSLMAALQYLMEIPVGAIIEAAYAGQRDAHNWSGASTVTGVTSIRDLPDELLEQLPDELAQLLSEGSKHDA